MSENYISQGCWPFQAVQDLCTKYDVNKSKRLAETQE